MNGTTTMAKRAGRGKSARESRQIAADDTEARKEREDKGRERRLLARKAHPPAPAWNDLVDKLRALMEQRQVSQSGLQRLTGGVISQSRLSRWLDYRGDPNQDQVVAMAEALRVPLAYLADPRRTEAPDLRALDRELYLAEMVRRLGCEAALNRLLLPEAGFVPARVEPAPGQAPARIPRLNVRKGGDAE